MAQAKPKSRKTARFKEDTPPATDGGMGMDAADEKNAFPLPSPSHRDPALNTTRFSNSTNQLPPYAAARYFVACLVLALTFFCVPPYGLFFLFV
jgi:hypothetical protein